MDDVEQKALLYVLAREMKKYHHEKDVYRGVLQAIKESGRFLDVDELLEDARQSPDIQARTDRAFAFLDKWLPPIPEVDLEKVQRLWLEKWESGEKKPN